MINVTNICRDMALKQCVIIVLLIKERRVIRLENLFRERIENISDKTSKNIKDRKIYVI